MLKIKHVMRTSPASPSQWQAITDNDMPVVVRYRGGLLQVFVGPVGSPVGGTERDMLDNFEETFRSILDDADPDHITLSKVCSLAGLTVEGQVSRWPGSPDYDPERREFIFDRKK